MNCYTGFHDPEAAHDDKVYFNLMKAKAQVVKFLQYRTVRVYALLMFGFVFMYLLRAIIPSNLSAEKHAGGLLELRTYELEYTSFQQFSAYETILQSKELAWKYNKETTIQDVIHPKDTDMTLEAIRFKKELNALKKELWKTLVEQGFTCVGAISLGVPYNVFMDSSGRLYLNIEIISIPNPWNNETVSISGIFDKAGVQHEETLFDEINVSFVETNRFVQVVNQTVLNLNAYCLQSYLNNFPFARQQQTEEVQDEL